MHCCQESDFVGHVPEVNVVGQTLDSLQDLFLDTHKRTLPNGHAPSRLETDDLGERSG
jgi:hypothetical protein